MVILIDQTIYIGQKLQREIRERSDGIASKRQGLFAGSSFKFCLIPAKNVT